MSYTPSTNEVEISGLTISSGGQNWAGETVIIPLTVSNPSQFYVLNTNGNQIQVDPTTAAELYATSVAINELNTIYGSGQAYPYPSAWQQVVSQVQSDFATENLIGLAEGFASQLPSLLPKAVGLAVPGVDVLFAAGIIEGIASTFLTVGTASYTNNLQLAVAEKYLQSATTLLQNSEADYQKYVFDDMTVPGSGISNVDQPINYSTVFNLLYNTVLSVDVGQTASNAIAGLAPSGQQESQGLAETIFNTVFSLIPGDLASVIGQLIGDRELFLTFAQSSNPTQFAASLQALVTNAENTAQSSMPFSAATLAKYQGELGTSIAETQGEVLGSSPATTPSAQPVISVSAESSDYTPVNSAVALHSLFVAAITPTGTSDEVDHYTLINTLQGPGELVIDNVVMAQDEITDVTPAEFQTAYFIASQPGTDEIAVIAFDSAGNSSNLASSLITVGAPTSPSTTSASDLKVTTASLISSDLVAGGGGTVAFSVENLGTGAAPNTALSQIYLSTHTTLDSSAILVSPGSISDMGLAASATVSEQLPFTLPTNIAGSYYLIAFAGDADQVTDGAVAGQTYAIPISVTATSPPPPAPPATPAPSGPSPIPITADAAITTRVGSEPAITSGALDAVDTQYSNATDLRYTIVTPPAYGYLIDDFYTTSTFTQADINNGLVDYVQNGTATSSDSFSFYVSDPAGYRSAVQTFTFNILPALTPPPPPAVTPQVTVELANDTGLPPEGGGAAFNTSDDTLTGTANPGATVELTDGSTGLGSAVADSTGIWSFSPPSGFAQGSHYITASVTISGQTASNYLSFDYDTIAPPAPSTPQLALGGNVADTSTPTFTGTAEANDEVLLLEGNTIIGSGMATPQGTWTMETGSLGLGYHNITAESVDPAGNMSPLSAGDTIEVVPPPPGEVTLDDATMIGAGDLSVVGTVTVSNESLTEYGAINADGFSLTNLSRTGFAFVSWNSAWAFAHNVDNISEYFDGQDVLIVPTNGIVADGPLFTNVASALADMIDLRQTNGAAFSLVSIDIGPTGDAPTSAVFTGTTASGQTITDTVELNLPENSALQPVALTGFNDVTDVKFTENRDDGGDPTSIAFDNIVVGDATPPPSPPATAPLLAPVTLDDAAMVSAGALPLVSSDQNVLSQSAY
jgi:hypothetical protein